MMLSFASDYAEGAHPAVLKRLIDTNLEQLPGYEEDAYCRAATEKIRAAVGLPEAEVYYLVGGTQTNRIVISSLLSGSDGVIAAHTGHINVHEAGAIESSGHKVLAIPGKDGKLAASDVRAYLEDFFANPDRDHLVYPGMVYISHPTEYGTIYSLAELTALSDVCRAYKIPLYVDGARLAYGLHGEGSDLTFKDLARLVDVFYIGGTKAGALCGEAVVFTSMPAPHAFRTYTKQQGAMLAKGRLLGVQFDALFTDGLYDAIGKYAVDLAMYLRDALKKKGYTLVPPSPTNQQFVVMENTRLAELGKKVTVSPWEKYDDTHTLVRLTTSWATEKENVDYLLSLL